MPHPKTICVDFDGVLHSYTSPFTTPDEILDPPVPGAIEWLNRMECEDEWVIAVYSSRSSHPKGISAMIAWLQQHGARVRYIVFPVDKPIAYLTIDDRAWCFQGTFPSPEEIAAFTPWNKREFGVKP